MKIPDCGKCLEAIFGSIPTLIVGEVLASTAMSRGISVDELLERIHAGHQEDAK